MLNTRCLKVLCLFISVLFGMQSLLTGCGKKNNVETSNNDKDTLTVNWYMLKPIDNLKDQEEVEAAANKIIKEKINAKLKINFVDSASWEEKMKVMSAAGEEYDLVLTSSWTNLIVQNVHRGAFLPLNDLLEKYAPDIKSKADPRAWKAVTYDGKIMAVPAQAPYSSPTAFVFKKELVEKYNFDYKGVKTLQDLEPYLDIIKKNEPSITPLLITAKASAPGMDPLGDSYEISSGIRYNELDGKLILNYDYPELVNNYRTLNQYYKKGYIAKDASTKTDFMAEAKSGKYAVLKESGGYTEDGSKSSSQYGYPCVEAIFRYPYITTNTMTSSATAISSTSRHPEKAMELLNIIWKDKFLSNTLAYGIEGKNYTIASGKGTDSPSVQVKTGSEQTWAVWHNFLGPLWDQWDSSWNTTQALEEMKKNNEIAKVSSILGFTFSAEPVKSDIAQVSAVLGEVKSIFYTGCMPDFDQYLAQTQQKLKNAGIDKVMAEMQKQLDQWKETNK